MRSDDMDKLYRENAETVYKYLYCLTRERELSEDLTNETFARAIRSAERYRGECKLSVWLCAIAKRLWYDELRRRQRGRELPLDETRLIADADIEREVIARQDRLEMYRRLHALDEATREVMYLRLAGDMTFDEIGDIVGRSGNWARVTYYRGKERLKEGVEDG